MRSAIRAPSASCRADAAQQGIPEAANELHSDVVVMGARGLSALSAGRNNFIGSIAYEVACSSERPVLIVPQTAKSISNGRQHR